MTAVSEIMAALIIPTVAVALDQEAVALAEEAAAVLDPAAVEAAAFVVADNLS